MKLFFCGDVMPGGVLPYQTEYMTDELRELMHGYDFRIGTLESAIGTDLPYDPIKMAGRKNIVYARNEDFFRVKEMGYDVVSLANNHVWDLGEDGLKSTINILKENNILYCGAGMNIEEASRPAVIEKDGLRIAILAYCMYGNQYLGYVELAGPNKAGINPLDIDKVIADIKKYKTEYDRVIVMPHWGREYRHHPLMICISMAKQMVEAGADAVLGSHPHQVQPFLTLKGKPVCFSMGNFLFPDFYMYPPRPIWYPDKDEDLSKIKDVVAYPFPIDEPIRQVWNPVSRYGCVVSMEIGKGKDTAKAIFVHATDDNIEEVCHNLPADIDYKLRKFGRMIKYPLARIYYKIKKKLHL